MSRRGWLIFLVVVNLIANVLSMLYFYPEGLPRIDGATDYLPIYAAIVIFFWAGGIQWLLLTFITSEYSSCGR